MPAADLTYWWRLFKKIALVTGVLLSFLGFIEILQSFYCIAGAGKRKKKVKENRYGVCGLYSLVLCVVDLWRCGVFVSFHP